MNYLDPRFLVVYIFYGLLWLFLSSSVVVYIIYRIMNKFNNFGDSTCTIDEYSRNGIHFRRNVDKVDRHEQRFLFANFGENPYEGIEHSIPEQLLKNSERDEDADSMWE